MTYSERYKKLNAAQKQAVDTIEGPLLVLAGPGTGKTELLSMRAASILSQTDTLPSNILCLTFTESGANAMRSRLSDIIGAESYKVAIQTFHSFGTEIINQNAEYFYDGASFQPADELTQYEIIRSIFAELDYTNPLATMHGDEYVHLKDTLQVISELKRSGLTSDELRQILDANTQVIETAEKKLADVFSNRISKSTVHLLAPVAQLVAEIPQPKLPPAITPYANVLALSLAHTIDAAIEQDSTKPITAWKKQWLAKDEAGNVILKDSARQKKLYAIAHIYYEYIRRMHEAGLFDYDDMILQVIHAMETQPALRANLQEQYHYIMVDEFQDTNLAQLRLLMDLTRGVEQPNVMAVGDDDQAIYSFQGADIGNIQRFREFYDDPTVIILTDNYRSTRRILDAARHVITQGTDRLENNDNDITKELSANITHAKTHVEISACASPDLERATIAKNIKERINAGVNPTDIAVLARRHHELVSLLPYLQAQGIPVNYERRENVLDNELIKLIELHARAIDLLNHEDHVSLDALLPELLAHPALALRPADIYKLSLYAWRGKKLWFEAMQTFPEFKPFADWLLVQSSASHTQSLEQQIDTIVGKTHDESSVPNDPDAYTSPVYKYYFSDQKLQETPDAYLSMLESLRTIRDLLRERHAAKEPSLHDFIDFIDTHRELNSSIPAIRRRASQATDKIHLMTVHKSKGLEYNHVYVIGAVDGAWGERVRSRSRLISYPANLPLASVGDTYDERLRLFYVAMTRAKHTLDISYCTTDANEKELQIASFLSDMQAPKHDIQPSKDYAELVQIAEIDWRGRLTQPLPDNLHELLLPTLERYKLSATHVNNFIDVTSGGPRNFLLTNLLRFPQAKSANAVYGTTIHSVLQRAHDYYVAMGERRPLEDLLGDFERILGEQHMTQQDYETYYTRGINALTAYLSEKYDSFTQSQKTELGFGNQQVMIGDAHLTGALDLVDIDKEIKTIRVTDYKTGKPSRDWKGKTEFEKIKLHKYRQQLMFYQLLVENSRDYQNYDFAGGVLQFVEPTTTGDIVALDLTFDDTELEYFATLVRAVWHSITALDLPDTDLYPQTLEGIKQFEQDLVDKYRLIV